jgi:hypothetical protein
MTISQSTLHFEKLFDSIVRTESGILILLTHVPDNATETNSVRPLSSGITIDVKSRQFPNARFPMIFIDAGSLIDVKPDPKNAFFLIMRRFDDSSIVISQSESHSEKLFNPSDSTDLGSENLSSPLPKNALSQISLNFEPLSKSTDRRFEQQEKQLAPNTSTQHGIEMFVNSRHWLNALQ